MLGISWIIRWLWGLAYFLAAHEIWDFIRESFGSLFGLVKLYGITSAPVFVEDAAKKLNELTISLNPVAMKLAADTLTSITGVSTSGEWVGYLAEKKATRLSVVNIGAEFFPVVTNMFDVPAAGDDAANRAPGSAWRNNLNAFFGTNLLFQMRSLTISTIARMTGLESLRHLEGLHQTVNWAFGFGWLSWAVMSNYMDATINDQMKKALNAQVLGKDMTLAEAIDAANKGYLSVNDENELLSNYGLRLPDRDIVKSLSLRLMTVSEALAAFIQGKFTAAELDTALHRQAFDRTKTDILTYQHQTSVTSNQAAHALIQGRIDETQYTELVNRAMRTPEAKKLEKEMAEKNIPEGDLKTLWYEQLIDNDYLTKAFRLQGYGPERATLEADLLKHERMLKLREEYVGIARKLYRDCAIEETQLRGILTDEHYSAEEINQVVKNEHANRRMRTFMPTTDMFKAVHLGLMNLDDALTSLQCRGWTYDESVIEALLRLQDKLPACDDVKLKDKALAQLIQAIGKASGVSGALLRPQILQYLQCFDAQFLLIPPTAHIEASDMHLPAPGNTTLKWSTTLATSAHITPLLGPVPLSGETVVHLTHSEGFTLTAESPIGKRTATVFIDVLPKGATLTP